MWRVGATPDVFLLGATEADESELGPFYGREAWSLHASAGRAASAERGRCAVSPAGEDEIGTWRVCAEL
jgi:hypothetical protein